MRLIVGLGNPGEKYKNNRHNVGVITLDALASRVDGDQWSVNRKLNCTIYTANQSLVLAKPQAMMNNSGEVVKKLITRYKVKMPDLWVVHDDLDLEIGNYKIQKSKGPRKHNGLLSIYDNLGTKDFWHVRIGVDNRSPDNRIPGEAYVLQNFTDEESVIIGKVINEVCGELLSRPKD